MSPERMKKNPKLSATTDDALRAAMTCGKSWMASIQVNLTIIEAYMNNAEAARIRAKIFLFMVMQTSENVGRGASYSARRGDAIRQKKLHLLKP